MEPKVKKAVLNRTDSSGFMHTSPFSRSQVNIIIPFHGEYSKVASLVRSIFVYTQTNPYQICLVDDGSPNKDFYEQMINSPEAQAHEMWEPQLIAFRHEEQRGFGAALHTGFSNTQSPWVCFMHSDCKVSRIDWLLKMGESLLKLKEKNVRMVSAMSDTPIPYVNSRLFSQQYKNQEDIILNQDEYLPLYCVLSHRGLYDKIGFVKPYPYVGYEDEELAYRMNQHGFKQGICGQSWVSHKVGATVDYLCKKNPSIKAAIESNRELCMRDMGL